MATIARIPYAQQLVSNPDYLYNFSDLAIWSIVECGIAITASSLATLRPLFVQLRFLASNHFTSHFTSIKAGSAVLPMFSSHNHNNTTIISASRRHDVQDNRYHEVTATAGTTAANGGQGVMTGGRETKDGIQVEKEFEMSVVTREPSQDSIDQLEAEVNEVIRPGTAKLHAGRDRHLSGSIRSSPRPSLANSQTSLWEAPTIVPGNSTTMLAGSSASSNGGAWPLDTTVQPYSVTHQSPRSLRSVRKTSSLRSRQQSQQSVRTVSGGVAFAQTDDTTRPNSQPHRFTYQSATSESGLITPGTQLSPAPNFHLPLRRQHQRVASSSSDASRTSGSAQGQSRGTFGSTAGMPSPLSRSAASSPATSGSTAIHFLGLRR